MPGYLSNRYITFNPAADAAKVAQDVNNLDTRVTAAEENIEDLQLNIGV